jgi:hypothetical protein
MEAGLMHLMDRNKELIIDALDAVPSREALRKTAGSHYRDRNDGFMRSHFSRSKHNFSRSRKVGKPVRVKPAHKTWAFV